MRNKHYKTNQINYKDKLLKIKKTQNEMNMKNIIKTEKKRIF